MAEESEIRKILRIEGIETVKQLRDYVKSLQDELVSADAGTKKYEETTHKLTLAQEKLSEVTKKNKEEQKAATDSIVGMERKYKELYNTYKLLSEEQRKSPFGLEMKDQLKQLSDELNKTKQNVGNFKDNIGRYTQSAMAAFQGLGGSIAGLKGPIGGANMAFKALSVNPVMIFLTALIGIVAKVIEGFKASERNTQALREAMAAFEPVGQAINTIFEKIANVLIKVVQWSGEAFTAIERFFTFTKEGKEALDQQVAANKELAKMKNNLEKNRRAYNELNSEQEARIAQLREEAAETTDKVEKEKLLTEAKDLQNQVNQRAVELAQQEYDIVVKENSLSPTNTENLNRESEAKVKLNNATEEAAKANRKLQKEINAVSSATKSGTQNTKDYTAQLMNIIETIESKNDTAIDKLEKQRKKWKDVADAALKAKQITKEYYDNIINSVNAFTNAEIKAENENSEKSFFEAFNDFVGIDSSVQKLEAKYNELLATVQKSHPELEDMLTTVYKDKLFGAKGEVYKSSEQMGKEIFDELTGGFLSGGEGSIEDFIKRFSGSDKSFDFGDIFLTGHSIKGSPAKAFVENYLAALAEDIESRKPEDYDNYVRFKESLENVKFLNSLGNNVNIEDFSEAFFEYQGFVDAMQFKWAKDMPKIIQDFKAYEALLAEFYKLKAQVAEMAAPEEKNSAGKFSSWFNQIFGNDEELEKNLDSMAAYTKATTQYLDSIAAGWKGLIDLRVANGKISEEQAKKEFERLKAFQYASAIINTAAGITQALTDPDVHTFYLRAANAAAVAATGIAQIASIKSASYSSTGGNGLANTNIQTPTILEEEPYTYTRNTETGSYIDYLNEHPIRAYVVDRDMKEGLDRYNEREKNTSF